MSSEPKVPKVPAGCVYIGKGPLPGATDKLHDGLLRCYPSLNIRFSNSKGSMYRSSRGLAARDALYAVELDSEAHEYFKEFIPALKEDVTTYEF